MQVNPRAGRSGWPSRFHTHASGGRIDRPPPGLIVRLWEHPGKHLGGPSERWPARVARVHGAGSSPLRPAAAGRCDIIVFPDPCRTPNAQPRTSPDMRGGVHGTPPHRNRGDLRMFSRLKLTNFKAWKDTGDVALRPVTMLLGTNSSGKSSLIQSLLLLKQTVQSPDR
ncbi:MAG: AAA family ATPase, partial [Pseudoxanthomonas sp.]|nr:AAA family ATPase [Pseudoxanthomonas sp.]